eukprot:Blabericola_migrator_1__4172@NODE_2276_length_3015_cov_340_360923_g380_i1_p3_GENE_NODE_2276_length_3015_cov_340_360923_g380_i1NODE_2276_length_3015_cov_340_360923_g380_i1_p3_ORF_typecomplete_len104_score0_53_NODE_2276_length_3015_cov_340_360923_g380_i1518829
MVLATGFKVIDALGYIHYSSTILCGKLETARGLNSCQRCCRLAMRLNSLILWWCLDYTQHDEPPELDGWSHARRALRYWHNGAEKTALMYELGNILFQAHGDQ